MKLRSLLILLMVGLALIPAYSLNRYLLKVIRPRDAAARFFLYILLNFVLVIVYTILVVGIILSIFPPGGR
jgi:hypothetical protein